MINTIVFYTALFIASGFLSFYVLWALYLLVMNLKRAHDNDTMTNTAYKLGTPLLIVGYLWDVICNLTYASVLFLEIPREWVITARLSRHIADEGWRGDLARWFCRHLLDPYDPSGCHCKK